MAQTPLELNATTLEAEMQWLNLVIKTRMDLRFGKQCEYSSVYEVKTPLLDDDNSFYARIVKHCGFGFKERIVLALSLCPHVKPQGLDPFFLKNKKYDRVYTEFGGLKGRYHSGFLPTGETAAFLIAGNSIEERMRVVDLFKPDHIFYKNNILKLNLNQGQEPLFSSGIEISEEYLTFLTSGDAYKPDFSTNFPAKRLSTKLDWTDLVLDPHVLGEVSEIAAWLEHQSTIMDDWGLSKQLKRGYRSLFYGPPGTGKTLTACLVGKQMGLDVYRVDLSQVVSKYIGETEKNMANIFDQAENKNWILFFDEADALFGKRTATSDSKDRHANQEVAYLLQRVEDFSGVVILATNLKANMDVAFTRRFQSIIYFPAPNVEQRYQLWENSFKTVKKDPDVDFSIIANEQKITGGSIINVLRYCSLSALRRGSNAVAMEDIREGIKRELRKEGKTM
jgi:hypothetical protein